MDTRDWTSIKGNWNRCKGQLKERWGKLTDDDLTRIDGDRDQLIGILQQRYGLARERIEAEVDDFAGTDLGNEAEGWAQRAKHKAAHFVEQTKNYFKDHKIRDMVHEAEDVVRRNYLVAMGVGLGAGFLLGMLTSGRREKLIVD